MALNEWGGTRASLQRTTVQLASPPGEGDLIKLVSRLHRELELLANLRVHSHDDTEALIDRAIAAIIQTHTILDYFVKAVSEDWIANEAIDRIIELDEEGEARIADQYEQADSLIKTIQTGRAASHAVYQLYDLIYGLNITADCEVLAQAGNYLKHLDASITIKNQGFDANIELIFDVPRVERRGGRLDYDRKRAPISTIRYIDASGHRHEELLADFLGRIVDHFHSLTIHLHPFLDPELADQIQWGLSAMPRGDAAPARPLLSRLRRPRGRGQ